MYARHGGNLTGVSSKYGWMPSTMQNYFGKEKVILRQFLLHTSGFIQDSQKSETILHQI